MDGAAEPEFDYLLIGCGYLGKRLLARLYADGRRVAVTSRQPDRRPDLAGFAARVIRHDVLHPAERLPTARKVVYAVGFDRAAGADRRAVYVDGLAKTLAVLPPPGRLAYVSSTGVFGDHGGGWVTEDTAPNPGDPEGQACLEAELLLRTVTKHWPTDVAIVRAAGIYGPGRMIGVERLLAGQPVAGDPAAHLNLIHVVDLARLVRYVMLLSRSELPNELYLASDGHPVMRQDFYAEAARLVGAPPPTFDPAAPGRIRGDRRIDSTFVRAESGLRFEYPTFREGLADAVRHLPPRVAATA